MKHGFVAFLLGVMVSGAAHAGPLRASLLSGEPRTHARPPLSFRLVQDNPLDPEPIYNSGIVTRTQVAPNATLGLGLLKSAPKRPSGEWKSDNGTPRSRKGLVSFLLKF